MRGCIALLSAVEARDEILSETISSNCFMMGGEWELCTFMYLARLVIGLFIGADGFSIGDEVEEIKWWQWGHLRFVLLVVWRRGGRIVGRGLTSWKLTFSTG